MEKETKLERLKKQLKEEEKKEKIKEKIQQEKHALKVGKMLVKTVGGKLDLDKYKSYLSQYEKALSNLKEL